MKKSLSESQIADIMARAKALVNEPLQTIEFTDAELGMDLDINVNTNFDFTTLPPLVVRPSTSVVRAPCPGTKKMCIRMPNALTQLFKDQAKRKGTQYQTLMIKALKEASKGW